MAYQSLPHKGLPDRLGTLCWLGRTIKGRGPDKVPQLPNQSGTALES